MLSCPALYEQSPYELPDQTDHEMWVADLKDFLLTSAFLFIKSG